MLERLYEAYERVSKVVINTPVMTSTRLNEELKSEIYFKCENFQRAGSFKIRGAYNTISQLSDEEKEAGIIAHSSGNHAQGVALSAQLLGIKATIVMPENAPKVKVEATKSYGAEVIFCENNIAARKAMTDDLIDRFGYTMIHPFDNENIIAGAASTAIELITEVGNLDLLIVPIGGGGLISGCSSYAKLSKRVKRVIGAEPEGANDAYQGFHNNKRIEFHSKGHPNTFCDGLLTTLAPRTYEYIQANVDDIITVSDEETLYAMRYLWERMKLIVEPSSATVLAALIRGIKTGEITTGSKVGLVLSGGNIDLDNFFNHLKTLAK